MGTGTLNPTDWQDAAMSKDVRVPRQLKDPFDQPKNQWTYDPDRVAYRGVSGPAAAQTQRAPVERRVVAGRVHHVQPASVLSTELPPWAKPFVMGLAVGFVVVLGVLMGQGLLKVDAKARAKPIYSQSDAADRKLIARVNGTNEASVKARNKAAPPAPRGSALHSESSNRGAWQNSGGVLVSSW
jgi:hypothetical protein